jgi:hypothetical protein
LDFRVVTPPLELNDSLVTLGLLSCAWATGQVESRTQRVNAVEMLFIVSAPGIVREHSTVRRLR